MDLKQLYGTYSICRKKIPALLLERGGGGVANFRPQLQGKDGRLRHAPSMAYAVFCALHYDERIAGTGDVLFSLVDAA